MEEWPPSVSPPWYFGIEQNERRMLNERGKTEYNEIER
jgi:hypothetical protein